MFILLDTRGMPVDPPADRVFAMVEDQGAGVTTRYVFALVVHKGNTLLWKTLGELGFKQYAGIAVTGSDADGTVQTWNDWSYWKVEYPDAPDVSQWPFLGWTDQAALDSYIDTDFDAPPPGATFQIPKTLTVNTAVLPTSMLNDAARHPWLGVQFQTSGNPPKPDGWEFRFEGALAGGGGAAKGVSLRIPSVTKARKTASVPDLPTRHLGLTILASSESIKTASDNEIHPGATVHLGESPPILGEGQNPVQALDDPKDTAQPEDQTKVLRAQGLDPATPDQGSLVFEHAGDGPLVFGLDPLLKGSKLTGVVRFRVRSTGLYLRHSSEEIALCRYASLQDAPVGIRVTVECPLMETAGKVIGDLPLVVPIKNLAEAAGVDEELELLEWTFQIALPAKFFANDEDDDPTDGVILSSTIDKRSWEFAERLINHAEAIADLGTGITDLSGWLFDLSGLLGGNADTKFQLSPSPFVGSVRKAASLKELMIPVQLTLVVSGRPLTFILFIQFDLKSFRLKSDKMYFAFPPVLEGETAQIVDVEIFALVIPNSRTAVDSLAPENAAGYIDFKQQSFVIQPPKNPSGEPDPPGPMLIFPGNLEADKMHKRVYLALEAFPPDTWPEKGGEDLYLRINDDGISFSAIISQDAQTTILDADEGAGAEEVAFQPLPERKGVRSELIVINNLIRSATVLADFDVPGVKDLRAEVTLGIRQERLGKAPVVYAMFDLDAINGKAIADFSVGYLRMSIDDLRLALRWDTGSNDWDVDAFVDGTISLSGAVTSTGKLDDLKKSDAIVIKDFNLLEANRGFGSIALKLGDPVEFSCLDGIFAVRLHDLQFEWGDEFVLKCGLAQVSFTKPSAFQVSIEVGALTLRFSGGSKVKLETPSSIGLQVSIGSAATYRGKIAYVDNDVERYFAAEGMLAIEGLPRAKTLLKIGSGRKQNGQLVPNVVLYGAMEMEIDLFAGVVVKELGAGIGINNRLAAIGEYPNADQILARIDDIEPDRISSWEFVEKNGFYLSIVGSTIFASTKGGEDVQNAYVASLVLSVDSELHIVAGGKLWLASSLKFVRQPNHWRRPALVGAVVLLLREQYMSVSLESRKNPAIESNKQLAKIFDKGKLRLTFVLSPDLVDYHVEEASYRDNFFGVQMQLSGTYRVAIFRRAVLVKAGLSVLGHYKNELSGGGGGFRFFGELSLDIEYGGLLQLDGIDLHGILDAWLYFEVEAYMSIRYPKSISWKGIKWGRKKVKSGRKRIDLGFDGGFAASNDGGFGFTGSVTISIPILRWRLRISPHLDINGGLVGTVRDRVAAFETKLDKFKQELLAPPPSARSAGAASIAAPKFKTEERWFRIDSDDKVLVLPAPEGKWFTPEIEDPTLVGARDDGAEFVEPVTRIEFFDPSTDELLLSLWSPWARSDDRDTDPNDIRDTLIAGINDPLLPTFRADVEAACGEMESLLVETALPLPADANDRTNWQDQFAAYLSQFDPQSIRVLSDPLVHGLDRAFFTEEDRASLPADVLPVRTRPLDEFFAGGPVAASGEDAALQYAEYQFYAQRAGREIALHGDDRTEFEELTQTRAMVAQLAGTRFQGDTEFVASETFLPDKSSPRQQIGMIAQRPNDVPAAQWAKAEFRIFRRDGNGISKVVFTSTPDKEQKRSIRDQIENAYTPQPIRQEFVAGDDQTPSARPRVRVHLPMSFDEALFTQPELYPVGVQIWRRLPGEANWSRVADQQFPNVLETTDYVTKQPVMVIRPYIFVDEFQVEKRQIGDRFEYNFRDVEFDGDASRVSYRYRLVYPGEPTPTSVGGTKAFGSVRPHLPKLPSFPSGVAVVIDVRSLYVPETVGQSPAIHFRLFQFGDADGDEEGGKLSPLTLAASNGGERLLPAPGDFEIWAERIAIGESGFFGRDAEFTNRSGDEPPKVDQLRRRARFKSADGRVRIPFSVVEESPEQDRVIFKLESNDFIRPGFGYRLLIRPTEQADERLLTETICFLARRMEGNNQPTLQAKPASHFELVPREAVDSVIDPGKLVGVAEFSVVELPADPKDPVGWSREVTQLRDSVRVIWREQDPLAGGAELIFTDRDDGAVSERQLCETVRASRFQGRLRTLDDETSLKLTPSEREHRLEFSKQPPPLPAAPGGTDGIDPYYVLRNLSVNPLFVALGTGAAQLGLFLGKPQEWDWINYLLRARVWKAAIRDYERSTVAVRGTVYRELRKLADQQLKLMFWGVRASIPRLSSISDAPSPQDWLDWWKSNQAKVTLSLASLKRAESDLLDLLNEIESSPDDEDPLQELIDDAVARAKVLDQSIAKALAAIVRRRMTLSKELDGVGQINAALLRFGEDARSLPGAARWAAALQTLNQFLRRYPNAPLPLTTRLLELIETPRGNALPKLAGEVKETVIALTKKAESISESARVASKAAGLTRVTNALQSYFAASGGRLQKRPHHQITVETTAEGSRIPQSIEVKTFFDDEFFDDQFSAGKTDHGNLILEGNSIRLLNLLERMGFALDVAAVDGEQEPVSPQALVSAVKEVLNKFDDEALATYHDGTTEQPLKHQVWIIQAFESDSEASVVEQADSKQRLETVGLGVIKLVVLPELLAKRLKARMTGPNMEQLDRWFNVRGLPLGSNEERKNLLERLGRAVRFLFKAPKPATTSAPATTGHAHAVIRMELAGHRWLTVPADGHVSHSRWHTPDQAGRRFDVRVRKVSRYEPLVRWAEAYYDLPNVDRLRALPAEFEPIVSRPDDPRRKPARHVSVLPDEQQIQFVFAPQAEAARALINNISAVRSGAAGHDVYFRYQLPPETEISYKKLLEAMDAESPMDPAVPHRQPFLRLGASPPQLFTHERLVSIPDLPFIYRYEAIASSQYNVRYLELDEEPEYPEWNPVCRAQRQPSLFAAYPATIDIDTNECTVDIPIPRVWDLFNQAERDAAPSPLSVEFSGKQIDADQLPDLSLTFRILERLAPDENAPPQDGLYMLVAELFLPLAAGYQDKDPPEYHPLLVNRQPGLVDMKEEDKRPKVTRGSRIVGLKEEYTYRVKAVFTPKKRDGNDPVFSDASMRFLEVRRAGQKSPPLPIVDGGS